MFGRRWGCHPHKSRRKSITICTITHPIASKQMPSKSLQQRLSTKIRFDSITIGLWKRCIVGRNSHSGEILSQPLNSTTAAFLIACQSRLGLTVKCIFDSRSRPLDSTCDMSNDLKKPSGACPNSARLYTPSAKPCQSLTTECCSSLHRWHQSCYPSTSSLRSRLLRSPSRPSIR
jgi:hypothetical protein